MTPTERANSTWMNCMHDTGQKTCRACIAAAITEAVVEDRAQRAAEARGMTGASIVNQMAGELSNTGRWAHLIEAAITEAVAEERARGEADVKAARAESFMMGKMEERARCAKIAREHGDTIGEKCWNHENRDRAASRCWEEIAAEIEKG